MRLPRTAHTVRPWRIHEIADDFHIEDVWALPTPGGPDDFAHLVRQMHDGDGAHTHSPLSRALFAVRWKLGEIFGWDEIRAGRAGVPTLRDRLPEDLRDSCPATDLKSVPFTSIYQTHDEWAAEIVNRTVHAVMHLGWVADGNGKGGYHARMAVLVKPNGVRGALYMAAIKPFRYLGVYPALLRSIGRQWDADVARRAAS
ncbi:hypothetical protein GCM10023347_48290 [Streptomyces chumphonensis]|uniref:DUF2867 domain-containing protein n=1 Tax=Streptomyces chumphonensis TaxID=1214925 RepID=A0A927EZS6_9ACTN|nr:DUF2867 domain-containing protein [Streptomyces chumphonensis]MBD3932995.1 DUF2867 domain-containing protein [Streptomyces chumphonensis]